MTRTIDLEDLVTIDFTEAINLEITCHKKVEKSHQNLCLAQYGNFKIIPKYSKKKKYESLKRFFD